MKFNILVATTARKDYVLKQLGKLGKEVLRIKQISWIFSQKFIITIEVTDLIEAKTVCEKIGCDFEVINLNFSEC